MVATMESRQSARAPTDVRMRPALPAVPASDEYCVDFDRYMIVYSDRMNCEEDDLLRLSPITGLMLGYNTLPQEEGSCGTGETTIGCYHGDRFVGSINFYTDREDHPESSVDPDGLVSLWFPLACLSHILAILHHEKNLSLSLITADLDGSELRPPMGALLTWPVPTGREAAADC